MTPSRATDPGTPRFEGVVLSGGLSRRMGRDKALIPLADGRLMSKVAADALRQAGATRVRSIGGNAVELHLISLEVTPDRFPDEGPLGGIITALDTAAEDLVMVLTCDLPNISAVEVSAIVAALASDPAADIAAALRAGRPQQLTACYRRSALASLVQAFYSGERSVRRGTEGLVVVEVEGLNQSRLVDADTPEDLAGFVGPLL